ncbi:MAG TPA: hypothetical protein VLX30_11615 [Burkholderiales bacterium]|nr:hypothetical protein [Burkholderiales bacterium]
MPTTSDSNKLLRRRPASLPIVEADRVNALELVARGEAIADALLTLARLFHRAPMLRHATH